MAVKIPSKLGSMSPTFQKAWYKRNKMPLPTHLTGSVKQASKEVKPSERVKKLQAKSIQAYGATRGVKVGGEHGSEDMRDTIKPLTRDQHSKIQAAERAAKAAAKAAAPKTPKVKKPLTQDERMAAIRRAFTRAKAKDRFDVPTVNPDDADHDDLRDVHQSLHVSRGYNEEVEQIDELKLSDVLKATRGKSPEEKEKIIKAMREKERASKPAPTPRKPEPAKDIPMHMRVYPPDMKYHGDSVELEGPVMNEVTKKEAEKTLGGPTKEMPKGPAGKHPLGYRLARSAARKAMKGAVSAVHKSMEKTMAKEEVEQIDEAFRLFHPGKKATVNYVDAYGFQGREKHPPVDGSLNGHTIRIKRYGDGLGKYGVSDTDAGGSRFQAVEGKVLTGPHKGKTFEFIHHELLHQNTNEEVEQVVEQDDSMEKKEMAQTQLHFMAYAAKEILEFIDMGGEIEEWYQNKLSKVQSEVESLHSYIEGEKRRTGMVKEEEQIDEKAPPGAKYERMVKHIKKGYAKGGLTPKEKSIAYATAWKAYGKKEEVETEETAEQVDEKYMGFKAVMAAAKKGGARDPAAVAAAIGRKKYGKEKFQAMAAAGKKANEEVVAEAEGTVAVTPKEKALAAHHGDPKKITYGDVIKARLKSAAAKKMGK